MTRWFPALAWHGAMIAGGFALATAAFAVTLQQRGTDTALALEADQLLEIAASPDDEWSDAIGPTRGLDLGDRLAVGLNGDDAPSNPEPPASGDGVAPASGDSRTLVALVVVVLGLGCLGLAIAYSRRGRTDD